MHDLQLTATRTLILKQGTHNLLPAITCDYQSVTMTMNGIHTHTHTNQVTTSGAGHTITATIYNSIATDDEI